MEVCWKYAVRTQAQRKIIIQRTEGRTCVRGCRGTVPDDTPIYKFGNM